MRLYWVSCMQCRWQAGYPLDEEQVKHFQGHRCRVCLEKNPASTQLFSVREVITSTKGGGRFSK